MASRSLKVILRRVLFTVLPAAGIVALVSGVRTALYDPIEYGVAPGPAIAIDPALAAEHLAGAIRLRTVTGQDATLVDSTAFLDLHGYLEISYPLVHARLRRETVSDLSLLFTWAGRDPTLPPGVLMGHLDVVPAVEPAVVVDTSQTDPSSAAARAASGSWLHPPFGGVVDSEYVWGRGALDDKVGVISILEAVEGLLREGFVPERTFYLAFGHDEEAGGSRGAAIISPLVMERSGTAPAFVLDEGGMVGVGLMAGIEKPVALIGIAEKGYLTLELTATGQGGHSSAPPKRTAVGRLSDAVSRLEHNPFPSRIDGAVAQMLRHLGPHMTLPRRVALANLWLFRPLVKRALGSGSRSASAIRTTTAPTMLTAGVRENVLPSEAKAVVNFRLLPGDSVASVIERVRSMVDDEEIQVQPVNVYFDASPVANADGPTFAMVAGMAAFSLDDRGVVVAPYLVPGGTDSRYFSRYTSNVFRFLPVVLSDRDLAGFHGVNERIRISSLVSAVRYFAGIIRQSDTLLTERASVPDSDTR